VAHLLDYHETVCPLRSVSYELLKTNGISESSAMFLMYINCESIAASAMFSIFMNCESIAKFNSTAMQNKKAIHCYKLKNKYKLTDNRIRSEISGFSTEKKLQKMQSKIKFEIRSENR
jgi:hypothetical protein